jgi:hypothetical protein
LARQDEFFVNDPLDIKENDEHPLDFALLLSHFFLGLGEFGLSVYSSCFFPPNTLPIFARNAFAPFPRVGQNLMLFFCWIHCKFPVTFTNHKFVGIYCFPYE